MEKWGIYVHIPWCRRRCPYCDFYFEIGAAQQGYANKILEEYERKKHLWPAQAPATLYFGGGTPSYISVKYLEALVDRVKAAMPWDSAREVAFECEPGTLSQPKLEAIKGIGVNRLSLGVENMNDEILRENGRAHVTEEVYRTHPWIQEQAFDQVNVDLISGMVGETWTTWQETVEKTIDLDTDSVTIYQMELPFNTVYSKTIREDEDLPGWRRLARLE